MKNSKDSLLFGFLFAVCFTLFFSCKKKEIEQHEILLSTEKHFESFFIPYDGWERHDSVKVSIDFQMGIVNVSVPYDFDVTSVQPRVRIASSATVLPKDKTILDFTTSQIYIITAQDQSKKEYIVSITRRPQPNILDVDFIPHINGASIAWGKPLSVFAKNIIRFLKDDKGQQIHNYVTLTNAATNQQLKLVAKLIGEDDSLNGKKAEIQIIIPDDTPVGLYSVGVIAGDKSASASKNLEIRYPDPVLIEFPKALKADQVIEIKGKYFTNIPRGTNIKPRFNVTKRTNLQDIQSMEWEVISYTETSATVKVNGYLVDMDYALLAPEYIYVFSRSGFWASASQYQVTLTK